MSILNIRPARRGESKAIIALAGGTGGGKTVTALYMARGMVNKPSEIGFLDTENKRGSLYADILDGPFMIGDLYPPFSPKRYSESIKEFQEAGIKVLVIDSVSHEWEGEGGCDDIANQKIGKMANWTGAKREHKSFMNTLLQCDMHVICCIRAREKVKVETVNGKQEFVPQGMQPVCEKNFMFEMTASMLIENEGKTQRFLKVPSFLKEAFGNGASYLGIETGKKIITWISEGEKEDPEIKRLKSEMLMACEKGIDAVVAVWNTVPIPLKKALEIHKNICKKSAEEYEAQAKEAMEEPDGNAAIKKINDLAAQASEALEATTETADDSAASESPVVYEEVKTDVFVQESAPAVPDENPSGLDEDEEEF